jgi:hypothetical protein
MLISILFLVLYIRDMSYPVPGGGSGGPVPGAFAGVQRIIPGSNITINPTDGIGNVTIDASGGGAVSQLIAGTNITLTPPTGLGAVTIDSAGGALPLDVSFNNVTVSYDINLTNPDIESGGTVSTITADGDGLGFYDTVIKTVAPFSSSKLKLQYNTVDTTFGNLSVNTINNQAYPIPISPGIKTGIITIPFGNTAGVSINIGAPPQGTQWGAAVFCPTTATFFAGGYAVWSGNIDPATNILFLTVYTGGLGLANTTDFSYIVAINTAA